MPNPSKILIVDDDYAIRMTLRDVLDSLGYKVSAVATGKEGLDAAAAESPDIVIVDVRLPDINGLDVVDRLKETNPAIQCIVMTAYSRDLPAGISLDGEEGYFAKPVDLEKMLSAIKERLI